MKFNNLNTNITLLTEEACEVAQICCKIQRFGIGSYHPDKGREHTNRSELEQEVGDFLAIVDILVDQGILCSHKLYEAKKRKLKKLEFWYEGKNT
jgi:NTP pyrophosphatase (non-canonical NTP hydrolase)